MVGRRAADPEVEHESRRTGRLLWSGIVFGCGIMSAEAFAGGSWRSGLSWAWAAFLVLVAVEEATRPGGVLA